MEWELIYTARNLAVADKRKPRQANLRRANFVQINFVFQQIIQVQSDYHNQ